MPVSRSSTSAGRPRLARPPRKSKYGGMDAPEPKRVKELEAENARRKRMFAELALDNAAIKDLIAKKP